MRFCHRIGTLIRFASVLTGFGLATLLLAVGPSPSDATEMEIARGSGIVGLALTENWTGLQEVVITLDPSGELSEEARATEGGQLDGATLINRGGRFVPDLLVVPGGTHMTVRSGDRQFHTAELTSAGRLLSHLALLADGPDFSFTVTIPGVIAVRDWMNPERDPAYIVVRETRYFDVSDGLGRFAIPGIPAGTYTLRAWHKDLGNLAFAVTVAEGVETRVVLSFATPKITNVSAAPLSASSTAEAN